MRTILTASAVLAALVPVQLRAEPKMSALEADLRKAIFEVCLPAQAAGQTAEAFIAENGDALRLWDVNMNDHDMNVWRLSNDERVTITGDEDTCLVSMMSEDRGQEFVDQVKVVVSENAAHEQALDLNRGAQGWMFCTVWQSGFVGSHVLVASMFDDRPQIGQVRPKKLRVIRVNVPRVSTCQRS